MQIKKKKTKNGQTPLTHKITKPMNQQKNPSTLNKTKHQTKQTKTPQQTKNSKKPKHLKNPQRKCFPIPETELHVTENEIILGEFLFATTIYQLTFKPAA